MTRGKGQRPGRARSPAPRTPPPPPPPGRERPGGSGPGAGPGARGPHRGKAPPLRGGGREREVTAEGEGRPSSRAEPLEGNPKSPGLARVPSSLLSLPSFPATPHCAPEALPRLPIPEDASLFPPAPGLALPAGVGGGCQEGRGLEAWLGRSGPSLGERLWVQALDPLLCQALSDPDPYRLTPLSFHCPHGPPPGSRSTQLFPPPPP